MVMLDVRAGRRRLMWERFIWVIDMAAYLLIAYAGYNAAFEPSVYVIETVQNFGAIGLWGVLMLVGGAVSFIGRLSKVWAIEYACNVFAAWGVGLYAVILIPSVLEGGSKVLLALVLAAWLLVLRRYAELRIFTSEPGLDTFRKRLDAALRRRTQLAVQRENY